MNSTPPPCPRKFAYWECPLENLPSLLFDGYYVYSEGLTDAARLRTSHENVSDVLDAVVRLMRVSHVHLSPSTNGPESLATAGAASTEALQARIAELEWALRAMADEFVKVFPSYYYAEPWAHDRNPVLRAARAALKEQQP